jgi:hypothetical protein
LHLDFRMLGFLLKSNTWKSFAMALLTYRHSTQLVLIACLAICNPAQASWFGSKTVNLEGSALSEKMRAHPLVISTTAAPLEIKSKAAAVGGFVLGFVLSSAAASGGVRPGQSAQQMQQSMQANMTIANNFNMNVQAFVKDKAAEQALKTVSQIAQEGPAPVVINQLVPALLATSDLKARMAQKDLPAQAEDLQLSIQQTEWKVDFSMASSDYTLSHIMQVQLFQKSSNTVFFSGSCNDATRKMPIEAWQKDDNAAIAKASQEIAEECTKQLMAKLQVKPFVQPKPTEQATAPAAVPTVAATPAADTAASSNLPAASAQEQTAKPAVPAAEAVVKRVDAEQDKPAAK